LNQPDLLRASYQLIRLFGASQGGNSKLTFQVFESQTDVNLPVTGVRGY
jgi:hypothetical protein